MTGPSLETVSDGFVGRVTGVDLSKVIDDGLEAFILPAWREHPVLHFPGQSFEPTQLRRFGEIFGVPEPEPPMNAKYLHADEDAVSYVGNVLPDGTAYPWGNQRATSWHSDQSYIKTSVSAGVLHCMKIPDSGGGTMFCNMYAAYEALSDEIKSKITGRQALHCYNRGIGGSAGPPLDKEKHGEWPVVRHPIVRTHPLSGRPALYVNRIHTFDIEGLPEGEGRDMLDTLISHATEDAFVYYHPWKVGDAVLWDQRCLMHRSAADYPTDQERLLMRVKITGDAPY